MLLLLLLIAPPAFAAATEARSAQEGKSASSSLYFLLFASPLARADFLGGLRERERERERDLADIKGPKIWFFVDSERGEVEIDQQSHKKVLANHDENRLRGASVHTHFQKGACSSSLSLSLSTSPPTVGIPVNHAWFRHIRVRVWPM